MKKLVVLAALALVAGLMALGGGRALASPATLWVNDDDPNGGGYAPPGTSCDDPGYIDISAAVAVASPGDTIKVCPGTYAGGVVIDEADVRLKAQGPLGAVQLAGTGATGPLFGLTIIADNVGVEGFEIYGFNGQHDASGIFVGGLSAGDTDNPADGAVIEHNNIHDNGNGIYLWQSNNNSIRHNEVHDSMNFDGDEGTGILSFNGYGDPQTAAANDAGRSGKNNDISHNVVHDNDRLAIFAGACTEAAYGCEGPAGVHADISGTTIDHNEAFGNGADGTEAIGLLDASGGTIAHNNVHDNPYLGIYVNFSDGAVVAHNDVTGPAQYGILVGDSQGVGLDHNKVNSNYYGIFVYGTSGSAFAHNSAKGNAVVDLYWDATGTNVFKDNKCGTASPSKAAWDCK